MKNAASRTAVRETVKQAEHNARKARDERLKRLMESNALRIAAVNEALRSGKVLRITTGAFGDFEVDSVSLDFVVTCYPAGQRDWLNSRMFHYHAGHLPEWEQKLGIASPVEAAS